MHHLALNLVKNAKIKELNPEERFAYIDDSEIDKKKKKLQNLNTTKASEKAESILMSWLQGKGENCQYWLLGDDELDKHLAKFWVEARQTDGTMYRTFSLSHLCYGINRCLKKCSHECDIIRVQTTQKAKLPPKKPVLNSRTMAMATVPVTKR